MTKITELVYRDRAYLVVDLGEDKGKHRYGTVDRKYVKNGRLTQQLNGLQMMLTYSVEDAIELRKGAVDYLVMMESGMTQEEAMRKMIENID